MKHMRKALCMLLALIMVIGLLPMAALAVDEEEPVADAEVVEATAAVEVETYDANMVTITKTKSVPLDTSKFYTIFHLDCGRNYFSAQQIKNIIDEMAKDGYNTLELAIGNDALRLVLDDMSVTANGTTYDSATVKSAVQSGNRSYRNNGTNELTQSEMDEIISYANSKNISILPLVNAPGHANTILAVLKAVGISNASYSNDPRTIDVRNAEAVNFALALVNKYIQYFAGKGCKIFNMGADEYANTSYGSGSMGFGHLQDAGEYGYYANFVNNMAAQIQNAGMTAMAFNDGIYFNNNTASTFDSNIAIAYWTPGWGSYNPMSAADLAAKGHKIINTNDAWYYVVGRTTQGYGYNSALNAAKNTKVTDIPGSNDPTAAGAMMCLWYDESAAYEEEKVKTLLSTLAENNADYFVVAPVTPEEPEVTEVSNNGVSVTAPGLTGVTVTEVASPAYKAKDGEQVKGYNITPAGYTQGDKATVSVPVPADWEDLTISVYDANDSKTISSKVVDGDVVFETTHFSEYDLLAADSNVKNVVNVELEVGETSTVYTEESGAYNSGAGLDTAIASSSITPVHTDGTVNITQVTSLESGKTYLLVNQRAAKMLGNESKGSGLAFAGAANTSDGKGGEVWIISTTSGGYYVQNDNGKYLSIGNGPVTLSDTPVVLSLSYIDRTSNLINRFSGWQIAQNHTEVSWTSTSVSYSSRNDSKYRNGTYYVDVNGDKQIVTNISAKRTNSNTTWTISYAGGTVSQTQSSAILYTRNETTKTYYLNDYHEDGEYAFGYTSGAVDDSGSRWAIFSITATEGVSNTTVQFTGVTPGTTSVVIGETQYNVTVKQKTVDVTVTVGATKSYTDTSITNPQQTMYSEDESIATATGSGTTLTIKGESVGETRVITPGCIYNITVVAEDLSEVDPLVIDWWITNYPITSTDPNHTPDASRTDNSKTVYATKLSAEAAYGENGVKMEDVVPATGTFEYAGSEGCVFWKGTHLTSSNKQTAAANVDYTAVTDSATYIRYYAGKWQYSADRVTWNTIASTDQIVAYYLQSTGITPEVDPMTKDWGLEVGKQDGSTSQVALSMAVVYPDGTLSPAEEDIYPNSTRIFNYWSNRDIGIVAPEVNDEYEVEKITVTPGARVSGKTGIFTKDPSDGINWEKKTTASGTQWFNETTYWDESAGGEPMVNGATADPPITWSAANKAYLVLIYLKPVHHDTNLTVQWVDDTAMATITSQEVVVDYTGDTAPTFLTHIVNNGTAGAPAGTIDLKDDAYIVNKSGVKQTFNKDLTKMQNIPGHYTSGLYSYVSANISEDGKVLTLHYTMDTTKLTHNYVVDFGLPVTINLSDLGITSTTNIKSVTTTANADYNSTNRNITYTPAGVLQGTQTVTVRVEYTSGNPTTINVGFVPATTVYYEEGFATYTGSWTSTGSKGSGTQTATAVPETKRSAAAGYGYDAKYAAEAVGASNGTQATTSTRGDKAEFTFTGTGIEVYANCTAAKDIMVVQLKQGDKYVKFANITTSTESSVYKDLNGSNQYNLPVFSMTNLGYGTYTLIVNCASGTINLDGFRVYGTRPAASPEYEKDMEDNPVFIELRDQILAKANVAKSGDPEQVYADAVAGLSSDDVASTLIVTVNDALKENGPKNELFLAPGDSISFKLNSTNAGRQVQVGLKAINGTVTWNGSNTIKTSTDMFYAVTPTNGVYTITNDSDNGAYLSITKIKVCDDPSAALAPLTEGDVDAILENLGLMTKGDADESGNLTLADVAKAYSLAIKGGVSEYLLKVLDMNGDGKLNLIDVSMLYAKYTGR